MSNEIPRFFLDKVIGKSFADTLRTTEQSLQERKRRLFERAKRMISEYGNRKNGSREMATLSTGIGDGQRVSFRLIENKGWTSSCIIESEAYQTGGNSGEEAKKLEILIDAEGARWGKKEASPEELNTAFNILVYMERFELPSGANTWENEQVIENMKRSSRRLFREWEKTRFSKDKEDK